jgi:plastocyanin
VSRLRFVLALAAVALVGVIAAGSASAATPTLTATLSGDNAFKIGLLFKGKPVKTLKAGTYKIVGNDQARTHDYRLRGPGVNKATSVTGKGKFTWTVKLKPGKYTYLCDPHKSFMKGSFTVK